MLEMNIFFFTWESLMTFLLLVGLEIILGIDNVLIISIVVASLPLVMRERARKVGLILALVFRLIFVSSAFWIVQSIKPLILNFSVRDLALIIGGLFIIGKAAQELYSMMGFKQEQLTDFCDDSATTINLRVASNIIAEESRMNSSLKPSRTTGFSVQKPPCHASLLGSYASSLLKIFLNNKLFFVVIQIVMLDLVFSIDSVIAAIGLTSHLFIIVPAVTVSFIAPLFCIGPLGEFILRHHSLKIMTLSFLIFLGISFVSEGFGYHIDKNYFYIMIGFALLLKILNTKYKQHRCR